MIFNYLKYGKTYLYLIILISPKIYCIGLKTKISIHSFAMLRCQIPCTLVQIQEYYVSQLPILFDCSKKNSLQEPT